MISNAPIAPRERRPETGSACARAALSVRGLILPSRAPRWRRRFPAPSLVVAVLMVVVIALGEIPWSIAPPAVAQALEKREKREQRDERKKQKQQKQKKHKKRKARETRQTGANGKPQDVIIVLQPGSDPERVAEEVGADPTHVYDHVLTGFAAEVSPSEIAELEDLPEVAAIVPDYPVKAFKVKTERAPRDRAAAEGRDAREKCKKKKNKQSRKKCVKQARKARKRQSRSTTPAPLPPNQPIQVIPTGVDRIDADVHPLAGIAQDGGAVAVDVAVLDTGIAAHPDLNVAGGVSCIVGNASHADDNGHGTHVAGTIGALDNAIGVVGVAPGARLWAVKVLDDRGEGAWSSVICGLNWVYGRGDTIDVINMSLGGGGSDSACRPASGRDPYDLHDVICTVVDAGIPVVVAAGNEGRNAANFVPAAYDEVITVSAFADSDGAPGAQGGTCRGAPDDTFAGFSNFGLDVDIAAPGVCIRSTIPGGGYAAFSGTSMAAPHVTGAVALHLAANPSATPDDVRGWLLNTASLPQDSPHGFTGDPDGSPEPLLFLGTD